MFPSDMPLLAADPAGLRLCFCQMIGFDRICLILS